MENRDRKEDKEEGKWILIRPDGSRIVLTEKIRDLIADAIDAGWGDRFGTEEAKLLEEIFGIESAYEG